MMLFASFPAFVVALGIGINALSLYVGLRRWIGFVPANGTPKAQVAVVLPLTGAASLPLLLDRLARQTLLPARLVVAVEAAEDPAHGAAMELRSRAPFPVEVVVAGPALDQAQKCRNQQAALEHLFSSDGIIVLMDGDIDPAPDWLAALVEPVTAGHFDMISGHRWQQVASPRLGAHLVTAIDRAATILPRLEFGALRTVWGGSTAISAAAARRIDLRTALERTLSDDLSIAAVAVESGLRFTTRGALLVASPNDQSLLSAWNFARRQYQIAHLYRPALWWLAVATISLRLVAWGAAIALASGGHWWGIIVLGALGLAKQATVIVIGCQARLPDPFPVVSVQLALGLLQPVVDIFHWTVVVASASTRTIRWGHVTYDVRASDDIRVRERRQFIA